MARDGDLIDKARMRTGLDDFGSDNFREGLHALTTSIDQEADLNTVGEHAVYERIILHLEQRLRIEDW